MVWVLAPVAVLVVALAIAFLFGPTIRTFFGPEFEPAPRDEESVNDAVHTGIRRRRPNSRRPA